MVEIIWIPGHSRPYGRDQLVGLGGDPDDPRIVDAGRFIDWLTGDEAQDVLQKNKVFVIPTNPESPLAHNFGGKNLPLLDYKKALTAEQKAKLLDKWVQTVRLSPR